MTKKSLVAALALGAGLAFAGSAYSQEATAPKAPSNTFDYASHRNVPAIDNGKCYEGVIFNYKLLLDGKIAQTDKKNVNILSRWFYDIDNDGKFGKAEEDAIKRGEPIYMHEEFNKTANSKIGEFLKAAEEYQKLYNSLKETTVSKDEVSKYQARVEALEEKLREAGRACGLENKALCADVPANEEPAHQLKFDSLGQALWEDMHKPSQEVPAYEQPQPAKVKSDFKPYWALTAGVNSNAKDNIEASLGARYNPAKNFGLGVSADVGFEKGRNLETYSETLGSGRSVYGEINEKDIFSVGFSGEIKAGPFIIGGGVAKRSSLRDTIEQIKRYDEILKANSNSASASETTGKAYGGFELMGKRFGVDVIGGYKFGKSNSGAFGGIKGVIKLGK
jgi:hypothetical protein